MEYNLVIAAGSQKDDFVEHINDMMKRGWRPQGGIAVTVSNQLVQSMIRDHNNPEVTYDLLKN
jgi:hypothetical protein